MAAALIVLAGLIAPPGVLGQAVEGGQPQSHPDGSDPAGAARPLAPALAESRYFFHRPELGYGSAARFGPLSVLLDRGFSTLMWDSAERHPARIDWDRGWANVWDALAHPGTAIDRWGGWGPVLRREVLPQGDVWEWAFAANYMGHALGGGVTYRALAEWYEEKGVPLPAVAGAVSAMATILVNEAIETRGLEHGVASTVFDVYVFEPIGIALFSLDPVARFFADDLHAQDWSPQSALTFPDGQLLNGAQMISYHWALPRVERLDVLLVAGQGSQMGALWDLDAEHALGAAVGFASKARRLDELGRERLEARASAALYLSRRGSLLGSLSLFKGMDNRAALNLYPGAIGGALRQFGFWALLRRGGDFSVGISSAHLPGLASGYDFWRAP